jgi:hypothetical protein
MGCNRLSAMRLRRCAHTYSRRQWRHIKCGDSLRCFIHSGQVGGRLVLWADPSGSVCGFFIGQRPPGIPLDCCSQSVTSAREYRTSRPTFTARGPMPRLRQSRSVSGETLRRWATSSVVSSCHFSTFIGFPSISAHTVCTLCEPMVTGIVGKTKCKPCLALSTFGQGGKGQKQWHGYRTPNTWPTA